MSEATKNFLVFGLQASGKTTFAAALWHLLDSREVMGTSLVKGKHQGHFEYLEKISQLWCEGWQVARTKSDEVEDVAINLRHPSSDTDLVLQFTDLAGENLENAFATRLCEPDFVKTVKRSSGMLLFVSADRIVDGVTILDLWAGLGIEAAGTSGGAADGTSPSPANGGAGDISSIEEERPWDPASTPLQVRLVDLLQSLPLVPFALTPFRVAVIVSAWDLSHEVTADAWLAKRMPLLNQFLRYGEVASDVRIYGVSAQGGELSKKGENPSHDQALLLATEPASKRIRIIGHGVGDHDLTHPIQWLTGLDETK
ncbi:MAG: hypothetical protein K2X57_06690 [Xanthobacteraceae bacterium]|nr:hypothetical protein [Xanthobacteraceae bacterium]